MRPCPTLPALHPVSTAAVIMTSAQVILPFNMTAPIHTDKREIQPPRSVTVISVLSHKLAEPHCALSVIINMASPYTGEVWICLNEISPCAGYCGAIKNQNVCLMLIKGNHPPLPRRPIHSQVRSPVLCLPLPRWEQDFPMDMRHWHYWCIEKKGFPTNTGII